MNRSRLIVGSAVLAAIAALSGCGGNGTGEQDVGDDTNGIQSGTLYARAIDGYLAGAIAYVDRNENGRLDAFEPRAITDRDGFFSYNHVTATDYCAAGAAELAEHCLRGAFVADGDLLIRVTGGYDTVTGLAFKGALSLRTSDLDRDDMRLVTPQTSMAAAAGSAQESLDILKRAGMLASTGSLDHDHIEGILSAEAIRAQMTTYLVRILAVAAEMGSSASSSEDLQADVWHTGYIAMAQQLAAQRARGHSDAFAEVFSTTSAMTEMVRRVAHAHRHPGQAIPEGFVLENESAMDPLVEFAAELVGLGEELIAALQAGSATPEQLKAALRVLALAGERGLEDSLDPELGDLFAWVRNQIAQPGVLGTDLAGLGADNVDLSALIDRSFDFDPSSSTISAHAIVPAAAATAFASIANKVFRVSVRDEEEQGDGLIFVIGDQGARSGNLQLCIRYRDDSGDFDTGSASDPSGAMLVSGRWSALNDYTLALNADIVGGVRPMLVKSVGVSGNDLKYRFDFGDDLSDWTGPAPAGFASGAVPANDAECRAALVQEFGSM